MEISEGEEDEIPMTKEAHRIKLMWQEKGRSTKPNKLNQRKQKNKTKNSFKKC